MTKKLLFLFSFLIAAFCGSANEVSPTVAAKTGLNFWASKATSVKGTPAILKSYTVSEQNVPLYYVFDIAPEGFVIVSAEDAITPILGYSYEGKYEADNLPPAYVYWMNQYKQSILKCRTERRAASPAVANVWAAYSQPVTQKSGSKSVTPLLTTRWSQETNYNYYCPADPNGINGHCVTGCVATSMAQVMKYWNYPTTGFGSHSYVHTYYGTLSADFGATTYAWDSMTNNPSSINKAICKLMYHCGVSVDMNYGPQESGSQTENVVSALKNYFHYRSTVNIYDKADYAMSDWCILLMDNLDEGKPIIYSGSGSGGGHAWVCDGYQDTVNFHMNWGWNGSMNGYFPLDTLAVSTYDFSSDQQAVLDIIPNFEYYCIPQQTFTQGAWTFGDGSGYSYYWNGTNCSWLIQPTGAETISLKFTQFNTEEGKDILKVYDGSSSTATLIGSFSGNNIPDSIVSTGSSLYLTFTSDSLNQGQGWTAVYKANYPVGKEEYNLDGNTTIYPNPAHSTLNVLFASPLQENVKVNIFNVTGQLVKSEVLPVASGKAAINLSNLHRGVYMITFNGEKSQYSTRFVIE